MSSHREINNAPGPAQVDNRIRMILEAQLRRVTARLAKVEQSMVFQKQRPRPAGHDLQYDPVYMALHTTKHELLGQQHVLTGRLRLFASGRAGAMDDEDELGMACSA